MISAESFASFAAARIPAVHVGGADDVLALDVRADLAPAVDAHDERRDAEGDQDRRGCVSAELEIFLGVISCLLAIGD